MSKPQPRRSEPDAGEAPSGNTTTLVRVDACPQGEGAAELHPQLRAQLRELRLRTGSAVPHLGLLLRLVSEHYQTIDNERRGIAESMRLMADEARAVALEASTHSSEHLQVILDHIKDVVLIVDEQGVIRSFNPTGERVFGCPQAQVLGQRIELLIPQLAAAASVTEVLQQLAA